MKWGTAMIKLLISLLLLSGLTYGDVAKANMNKIAILPTVSNSMSDTVTQKLTEEIIYHSQWIDNFIFIEQDKVNNIFKIKDSCIKVDCLSKIAHVLKCNYLLISEIETADSLITFELSIYDFDSFGIVESENIVLEGNIDELFGDIKELSINILRKIKAKKVKSVKETPSKKSPVPEPTKENTAPDVKNNYFLLYSGGIVAAGIVIGAILFTKTETPENQKVKIKKDITLE